METRLKKSAFTRALSLILSIMLALSAMIIPLSSVTTASAGTTVTGSTVSGISSTIYIPSSYKDGTNVPLYVAMHGCTQSYSQFATSSDINALAEEKGFIVVHLQQSSSNNMRTCFKWYSDQSRTGTEPKAIISIIDDVKSKYSIDNDKVFCFGFSAGAAMAHLLCACYPDVFSGGGIGSGLPFKSATLLNYSSAMSSGTSVDNDTLAGYIVSAMSSYKRTIPMIVFHGNNDSTVNYKNGAACTMSWVLAMNQIGADIDTTPTKTTGSNYTVESYIDANTEKAIVQYYLVSNMDHAWSGGKGSSYSYASGPDATRIMYEFFEEYWSDSTPIDKNAPVTTVNPSSGSYTTEITVSFAVDEEATTYYTTDGTTPTTNSKKYSAPFALSSTTTVKYFSVDTAGNKENVKTAVYNINIPVPDTTAPVTSITPSAGVYYEPVTVKLSTNEDATTYYTTDGAEPTVSSMIYTGEFVLTTDATVKFFSVDTEGNTEEVKSVSYIIITGDVKGTSVELDIEGRPAKLYISGKYRQGIDIPLVVMLHGDGQTAEQFELLTNMNDVADDRGFNVLYLSANNSNPLASWEWYNTSTQAGSGDTAYIVDAISTINATYSIDDSRIYAVGFGAGAAMANIVAATQPTLIKAIAVVSGTQYASASDLNTSFNAKEIGSTASSQLIVDAMGNKGNVTPVIVIHGAKDETFNVVNADLTVSQWIGANEILDNGADDFSVSATPSETETFTAYSRYIYNNRNGFPVIEKYIISNMGYAWSGGNVAGDYTYTSGPNTSELIYDFFAKTANLDYFVEVKEIDKTAPITTISPNGSTFEGSVKITLSVNENAVTYYTIDGTIPTTASTVYTAPFTVSETTTVKYFSVDESGNTEDVKSENYTIIQKQYTTTEVSYDKSLSGYAGTITYFGYGTDVVKAGLAGLYNGESYRGIVSFDTSKYDFSDVESAVLRLTVESWGSSVNSISVDIADDYFGSSGVQLADFSATATVSSIGTASPISSGNIDITIPASAYSYLSNHIEFRICSTITNGFSESVVTFSNATLIVNHKASGASLYSLKSTSGRSVGYALDDIVSFADVNLKNALISAGCDVNSDGELTKSEMEKVYGINLSDLSLENISGLEYATNLKYIDLSNNLLTDIDALANCAELQYVNISNNLLISIDALANASKMFILVADNNNITSVSAFAGNNSLVTISFAENEIFDISALKNITSLRSATFNANAIADIAALSTLTYVNYLNFEDNEIDSLVPIADLDYLFGANFNTNYLDITEGGENANIVDDFANNGVDITVENQKEKVIPTEIIDVTYVVDGDSVIFTIKSIPGFNRIKITTADNLKGYIKYTSSFVTDEDGYETSTITVDAITGTTRYAFDGRFASSGIYASDYFFVDVTVEAVEIFKSVSYEIKDDKIIFTVVTAAGEYNRIKVANADSLKTSLGVGGYTVNEIGDYVWTIKIAAPTETVTYTFDLRSSETNKYIKEYYNFEVEYVDVEIYKSVSYEVVGDKIVFTVVTIAGDYNRIKVANVNDVGTSLGVSNNYIVDENGNYIWTVKTDAPKETTTFAFDLRTTAMKYLKDYYTVKVEYVDEVIFKSTSYEIKDGKVIFTAVTKAGDYNRVKISLLDNITSYVKYVDTYTVNADGDYVWTLKFNAPTAVTEYALDIRIASAMKYVKDYYYVTVDPTTADPEPETVFVSGSGVITDGKLTFTIVTLPTTVNRVKVMLTNNQSSYVKLIDKHTVDANGNYVWTATVAAPSDTTSYTCDVRSSETGRYMKDYFTFEVAVEEKKEIYKSVSYEIVDGKIVFTVVTAAGNYDRIKLANAETPKTSIAVGGYTVADNGDYVWTVKTNAPAESTTYAFDLRIANEYTYLKDYYIYDVAI